MILAKAQALLLFFCYFVFLTTEANAEDDKRVSEKPVSGIC